MPVNYIILKVRIIMEKDILSKITQGNWIAKLNRDGSWVVMSGNIVIATLHRKDWPEWNEANAQLLVNAPKTLKERNKLLKTIKTALKTSSIWSYLPDVAQILSQAIAEVEDSK